MLILSKTLADIRWKISIFQRYICIIQESNPSTGIVDIHPYWVTKNVSISLEVILNQRVLQEEEEEEADVMPLFKRKCLSQKLSFWGEWLQKVHHLTITTRGPGIPRMKQQFLTPFLAKT